MNASLRHLEIVVMRFDVLLRDVFRDDLVRDIAARRDEVTACPQMTSPKRSVQRPEIPHQSIRTLTLDRVHHSARRKRRRNAQQQVNVIRTDVPLQDVDVVRLADLPNQFPKTFTNLSSKNRLAVLWDEDEVVVTLVGRMRPVAIRSHCIPKYRKPPEGFALRRGVSPIPGRGH